jgi:phage nucleotide-binding protein
MAATLIRPTDVLDATAPPLLIYGQPGSWKTSIACTGEKPLLLDFDKGAHRSKFRQDVVRFDCWKDVLDAQADGLFKPYQEIVSDTVGHLLDLMSLAIMDEAAKNGNRNGGLSMQGFGVLKGRFGQWVRALRAEGKQLVLLAHEKEEKDGENRVMRPAIVGGSYGTVMEMCDLVGYLSIRNGKRVLDFNPTDSYHAKTRAGSSRSRSPTCPCRRGSWPTCWPRPAR